jgi:hypothetical protein
MRTAYSFSVLRYVHDPSTQEFINIGMAVYAPEAGFLRAICTKHYRRISRMFAKIDGARFRQLTAYIQERITAMGESLPHELPFQNGLDIAAV